MVEDALRHGSLGQRTTTLSYGRRHPRRGHRGPRVGERSATALARVADQSVLVINPIIFAEVSVGFDRVEDLEEALPPAIY